MGGVLPPASRRAAEAFAARLRERDGDELRHAADDGAGAALAGAHHAALKGAPALAHVLVKRRRAGPPGAGHGSPVAQRGTPRNSGPAHRGRRLGGERQAPRAGLATRADAAVELAGQVHEEAGHERLPDDLEDVAAGEHAADARAVELADRAAGGALALEEARVHGPAAGGEGEAGAGG